MSDPFNDIERKFYNLGRDIARALPDWVHEVLDMVGLMAQVNMENIGTEGLSQENRLAALALMPVHPSKLTSRGGRLARSLAPGGGGFNAMTGQREGIQEVRTEGQRVIGKKGTKVPYANIHQKGGTVTQTVTELQHKFFWAMALQFNSEMFRAMALKYKPGDTRTFTIPARPYMPDDNDVKRAADRHFKDRMADMISSRSEMIGG